jgi:hypothetical protein
MWAVGGAGARSGDHIHRAGFRITLAPLSHHLQDSTHTSFGVVTTGFGLIG